MRLLSDTEHQFLERKSASDKVGWLKTVVALANSTPVGYPAVLYIGVNDKGEITGLKDVEAILKSFSDVIDKAVWPPDYTLPKTVSRAGKVCLAVIIPGSEERPHFAGKSYVRLGTQTKEASEPQFDQIVAQRSVRRAKS